MQLINNTVLIPFSSDAFTFTRDHLPSCIVLVFWGVFFFINPG